MFFSWVLQADAAQSEADALYDDVLTGSVDSVMARVKVEAESDKSKPESTEASKPQTGPLSVYVGHFNWVRSANCYSSCV